MEPRKESKAETLAKGLQSAQKQLSGIIKHYMPAYANDRIWEKEYAFVFLDAPEHSAPLTSALRQQIHGNRHLIPDSVLDELTCSAYILVGDHLFFVEKSRNKITEIEVDKTKLQQLRKLHGQHENEAPPVNEIEKITGHKFKKESIGEIKESDPLQIQFSKHAMLAMQEAEELVQNLGKLADGVSEYLKQEKTPVIEEKVPEGLTQQLGQFISNATATDAVDRALKQLQKPSKDDPSANPSLLKESGKLALEMTSTLIDQIPGLRTVINVTKPLHQSLLLGFLAPLSTPAALYQFYVTNRWYAETAMSATKTGVSATKAYPTARDFIRDQRDGVLHPWQKLSSHCEAMYKLAQQAKLPPEALTQLETARNNLAELQVKILLNPSQSTQILKDQLKGFTQTLTNIAATYFTSDSSLSLSKLNDLRKVDWTEMRDKVGTQYESFVDGMLKQGADLSQETLTKIVDASHEIELAHHLRYGSLLEEVRPVFDEMESIFHERGIPGARNPLGYDKKQEDALKAKLKEAESQAKNTEKKSTDLSAIIDHLDWYMFFGNDITKPDSAWRKLGYEENKPTITTVKEFEEKSCILLKQLTQIKASHLFTADDLKAVDQIENRLISGISLEKKRELNKELKEQTEETAQHLRKKLTEAIGNQVLQTAKNKHKSTLASAAATLQNLRKEQEKSREDKHNNSWPPKEFTTVFNIINKEKARLNDEELNVKKYTEALQELEKMRTEYAVRTLKKEGLINLIEAVKQGKDNPKANIQQKRKLSILLADLLEHGNREVDLENAHHNSVDFISHPNHIIELIEATHKLDPALAHALTVEAILAGYTNEDQLKNILETNDKALIRQDFVNTLDRITPEQVFSMLDGTAKDPPDETMKKRFLLLVEVLTPNNSALSTYDDELFNTVKDYTLAPKKGGISKIGLILFLLNNHDDPNIKNKLITFIGKLVNSDPELANNIFNYQNNENRFSGKFQQIHDLLKEHCASANDIQIRGLYYGALVNSLSFTSSDSIISYDEFLQDNAIVIITLHKALYGNTEEQEIGPIFDLYTNPWALSELIEDFSAKNLLPGSHAEKKLREIHSTLTHLQDRELKAEVSKSPTQIKNVLENTRQKIEDGMKHLFSDYANENFIWNDKAKSEIKPIQKDDPLSIQISKRSLNILTKTENITQKISTLLLELKKSQKQIKTIAKNTPDVMRALDELITELSELHTLAEQSGVTAETLKQLTTLKNAIVTLPAQILNNPEAVQTALADQFPNISKVLTDLTTSFKRPAAPIEPERKYATDQQLSITEVMPDHFTDYAANSFIIAKNPSWRAIYLDNIKAPHAIHFDDAPGLEKILDKQSSVTITTETSQAIKNILATRWDPTAQGRAEWYPLIEPLRTVMQGSQNLHEFFNNFVKHADRQGIKLDAEQKKLIEETAAAFKDAKQDAKGYYLYNANETPFSESLKGLYNVNWAVNELSRGFWEHSGAMSPLSSIIQAGEHGAPIWGHYWKIKWPELGGHAGVLANQLMNAMLIYGKEKTFPQLERIAQSTHEAELKHHLRFGVLTEPFRPLFDGLETTFHSRGLGASANPFSYDSAIEEQLESNLVELRHEKLKLHGEKNRTTGEMKKTIEKQISNLEAKIGNHEDAIEQNKKIRQEFAIRCLQQEGIISLIEAAKQGKDDQKLNLEHKRRLVILLADINQTSRERALANAHDIATKFAIDPKEIEEFTDNVDKINPALGHALAVEAVLAGYDPKGISPHIYTDDIALSKQTLFNILDRLEANQVLTILNKDQPVPATLLAKLIKGETPNYSSLQSEEKLDRASLLNIIKTSYFSKDQPEKQKNKLGLFLGRLARVDADIAKLIFADTEEKSTLKILRDECLTRPSGGNAQPNPALYFESLVNSFDYHYTDNKHANENRTAENFIENNKATILKIHHALYPNQNAEDNVIKKYQENPFSLLQDIESFIKDKTSANSEAEKRLSEFASAFILCNDNHNIRYKLLTQQEKQHGSRFVQHLELLTIESSVKFWQLIKKDLIGKQKNSLIDEMKNEIGKVQKSAEALDIKQAEFISRSNEILKEYKDRINRITNSLKPNGNRFLSKAGNLLLKKNGSHIAAYRHAVQEINKAKEETEAKLQQLKVDIDATKLLSPANKSEHLIKQLNNIENILDNYASDRKRSLNAGFGLRAEKIKLVMAYKNNFNALISKVKSNPGDYNTHILKAEALAEDLRLAHRTLLKNHNKGHKAGKLEKSILTTQSLLGVSHTEQDFRDDLAKPLTRIGKIIAAIRSAFSSKPPQQRNISQL